MIKQVILLAITLVISLVFWLVIKPLIEGPLSASWQIKEATIWLWPLGLLCISGCLMALSFLLLNPWAVRLIISLNLIIFALLFNVKEIIIWGGVVVALFFQLAAWKIIREEGKNRLYLDLKSIIRPGMGRLITSILILISFAYFLSSEVQEAAQKKELPGAVRKTVQVVVGSYLGENLEAQNQSLRTQATETVLKQITNFLNPYFIYLPPVLAFSLFLILQGLSAVFIWLATILALLVFWVLKLLKLVKIERESKEAEVIEF